MRHAAARRWRRLALHAIRVGLFTSVVALIHLGSARTSQTRAPAALENLKLAQVKSLFPQAAALGDEAADGGRAVLDAAGRPLGHMVQTSPQSDHIFGFSGPTNVLIAFGDDDRIRGIEILDSGDTRDHVRRVAAERSFLESFNGLSWDEAARRTEVEAVSGATLTALAVHESVVNRLGGGRPSLRFPEPLTLDDVQTLFHDAAAFSVDDSFAALWHVTAADGRALGTILRTSPAADQLIGYQGPTETLIAFAPDGRVQGIMPRGSFDNEPYVTYVREDAYFRSLFDGLELTELATLDLEEAEVEGVSGATMTSQAVARGLVEAAAEHRTARLDAEAKPQDAARGFSLHDYGTAAVVLAGLVIGLTRLRARRGLRMAFQCLLIGYLGLTAGNLVSQASLAGWARHGIPCRSAAGLVVLTAATLLAPIATGRNVYCSHLCPHGAAQQLLKRRLPWQMRPPRWLMRVLLLVPAALLIWCVFVVLLELPYSLVDFEPFDAWVLGVAGWATLTIAAAGLLASLFVPMAYCRYGCPTGALLGYLRFNAQSDRWTRCDWLALALAGLAAALHWG